ncbi:MAG: rpfC 1, partial [Labilithrix sp.]|nr:rpfC 1 [Labilithrix sp.]
DGFQVIEHLRERERTTGGRLPVIALTARSRAEDRARCLAAGMDDFLAKPIQADVLFDAIERLVGPTSRDELATASLITPSVLLSAAGGDPAILARICEVLVTRVPEDLGAVEAAFRDRDAPRLREAAHLLCGLVAAFSTVVSSVASDLEDQAALGDLDMAGPLVEQLRSLVPGLREQVANVTFESLERAAVPGPHF